MHKSFVINVIARLLIFSSGMMLFPLLWAFADNPYSRESLAFEATILFGLLSGVLLMKCFPLVKIDLKKINDKDALAIVGLAWIALSAFGAVPLFVSGAAPSYTDSIFEIASGFTTTGASIFTDVEVLPPGIQFWRCFSQWLGGMGIIVLYIALLPAIGASGYQLYKAEAAGVSVDKIEPRIKETAKSLWGVYFLLSVLQIVLMRFGGMTWFDSLCHTFATLATGGFSTKNASMGAFSPYLQWVVIVFMILGGINFILHYQVLRGRIRVLWKDEELIFFLQSVVIVASFFTVVLWAQGISKAPLRDAAFNVISVYTTTGFATTDFALWPYALQVVLVILLLVGSCGGSTSGGLKLTRFLLMMKFIFRSVVQSVFPNLVSPIRFNGNPLSEKVVVGVLAFVLTYIVILGTGTIVLVILEGCDLVTAFTACLATMSNAGPGLGRVGPMLNFAWISEPGKWLLTFLMLAGRLELYAILILFLPVTWRK